MPVSGYDVAVLQRVVNRAALLLGAALVLAYAADAAWVAARTHDNRPPTRTVQVHLLLKVPQKGNRIEFISGGTRAVPCLESLFPHSGLTPCWYAERHTRREIDY